MTDSMNGTTPKILKKSMYNVFERIKLPNRENNNDKKESPRSDRSNTDRDNTKVQYQ